jgi:putative transcriptional regulator
MTRQDNAYAAFMLDHAAGRLSSAEFLVAELHRALSPEGQRLAGMLDCAGGEVLESLPPAEVAAARPAPVAGEAVGPPRDALAPWLERDLLALPWRRSIFGVQELRTDMPMAKLLRLNPGERAPAHSHGRRDVTIVLQGSFADEFGLYNRGDLAFAEPGIRHEPRAVGDAPCVCMIVTESGRPVRGLLGLFGIGVRKQKDLDA